MSSKCIPMRKNETLRSCFSAALVLLLAYLLSACTGVLQGKRLAEAISNDQVNVALRKTTSDSISLSYTGCSGFFIEYQNQVVIHDPFFSNVGPLVPLAFKKIHPDTTAIDVFFERYFLNRKDLAGDAKLLLVSHTHYDHMLDVPYIYNELLNQDSVMMYGSNDMMKIMESQRKEGVPLSAQVISVEVAVEDRQLSSEWYYSINKQIRVLPIYTDHAPHFYGLHFYTGSPRKNPKKAAHWKEGTNISYFIDFLDESGEINFRIYINSSATDESEYIIPHDVLAERPVDLAILCAASFAYVDAYPSALLKSLNPQHIIVSHWENFFQKREKLMEKPMIVPFTNLRKFLANVDKTTQQLGQQPTWTLPALEVEVIIRF